MDAATVRREYAAELRNRTRTSGVLIGLIALFAVPAWFGFDLVLEPERAPQFIAVRLLCAIPIGALLFCLWRRPIGRRHPAALTFLILLVVQSEVAWFVVHAQNHRDSYALGLTLAISGSGCLFNARTRWTVAVAATTWVAVGIALLLAPVAVPGPHLVNAAFFLTTASLIAVVAHAQRDRLSMGELTARAQLQQEQQRTQELLARVERLSQEDPLTGLANRRRWDAELDALCLRAREGTHRGAVVLLDVDHFKQINDRYGHAGGDEALRHVAALLHATVPPTCLVARLGGDEFAVLIPEASEDDAVTLAQHVRRSALDLRPPRLAGEGVSLSLGVAPCAGPDADPDRVMSLADAQLYRAKATRNTVAAAELPSVSIPGQWTGDVRTTVLP